MDYVHPPFSIPVRASADVADLAELTYRGCLHAEGHPCVVCVLLPGGATKVSEASEMEAIEAFLIYRVVGFNQVWQRNRSLLNRV